VRLGLRGRFVAVLALVSALTLAVAAVALLSPLDRQLRVNGRESLARTVRGELGDYTKLSEDAVYPRSRRLQAAMRPLRRTGAEVAILDHNGHLLVATDPDGTEPFVAAAAALRTGHAQTQITGSGSQAEAEVAIPTKIDGIRVVVTARRSLDDIADVTRVVRDAFAWAAGAGLLGALLVGGLIAGRLAGRIRRLRDTAERVAHVGPVAEFQPEGGRDEIGDLSRTFAFMQERLREQEQARRTFVSTASHELRTPVASMQVMLDLLISDLEAVPIAGEDALRQARRVDEQAVRLSRLAGDLLDVSRIDAGLPLRSEPVELGEVLRSVIAELESRLAEQARAVTVSGEEGRWALGDPGSVAQILRILLDNALRHSPASGAVRVALSTRDDTLAIAVEDDGAGVSAEDRERIFERFARGAQAAAGGAGLGLAIGRELARQMRGDLVLEDAATGARFVLLLPRAPLQSNT
jgi:signal transduction histidine kinase